MMKFDEHIKRNTITLPNLDSEGVYEIPPESYSIPIPHVRCFDEIGKENF